MMTRRPRPGTPLLVALCVLGALLPSSPSLAQANRVLSVEVQGNQRISTDAILQVVATKPGEEFSREQLDRDVREIHGMGWFVEPPATRVEETPEGVKVTFIVREWPVIERIEITGNRVIPTETLRAAMQTKEGSLLNIPLFSRDIEAIERLYTERGYVGRVVGDTLALDFEKTGVLKIPIVEATVEKVNITGNRKTKTPVIRRELTLKPGDTFSLNDLRKDYARLDRLNIFESIEQTTAAGSELGKVVVNWAVKEKRTGQVSVGLGYSARERLVGRAELSETNFRGQAEAVNLLWETGGFSGRNSFQVGYYKPWLDRNRTSLSVDLYDKLVYRFSTRFGRDASGRTDRYDERRRGGTLTLARPLSETFRLALTGRYDDVHTADVTSLQNTFPIQDGTVTTGTVRGTQDTRDFAINPTGGWFNTAWIESGAANLRKSSIASDELGSKPITKLAADIRRYVALKPHKGKTPAERSRERIPVLALRATAGTSAGRLPFFEQFFLGGADSLRGYLEDRFWGRNMFLASAEYRRPLAQALTGVLFVDVGDAWNSRSAFQFDDPALQTRFRQHSDFSPQASAGVGLRVTTPIGPIRLDYGFGSEGSRLHFSIGHSF
jgi:outer membrane protein insertion porin family